MRDRARSIGRIGEATSGSAAADEHEPRGVGLGTALLIGVLDAALAVLVPVVLLAAVALLVWAVDDGARPAWSGFFDAAGDLWLLGHGVDLRIAPAAGAAWTVTLAALGPGLVTLLAGFRAGRRAARTGHPGPVLAAAALTVLALDALLLVVVADRTAAPDPVQAVLLPAVDLVAGVLAGTVHERGRSAATTPATVAGAADAIRLGLGAAAAVVAAAALLTTLLLAAGLPRVVGLYESAHAGAVGGFALTIAQLALLPTAVVWAAAWLLGPGFALGAGSSVAPLGVHLGPLPALPLLGALPSRSGPLALAVVLVPVLAGFALGVVVAKRSATRVGPARAFALGAAGGVVAGVALGLLAAFAAGAAGPGRLAAVGPDALLVGAAAAAEIGLPAMLGLALGRPAEIPSTRWLETTDVPEPTRDPVHQPARW